MGWGWLGVFPDEELDREAARLGIPEPVTYWLMSDLPLVASLVDWEG